jgi:hypothetical protein
MSVKAVGVIANPKPPVTEPSSLAPAAIGFEPVYPLLQDAHVANAIIELQQGVVLH